MLNITNQQGNANQNHNISHSLGWLLKKKKITNVDEDVEKLEPSYTAGRDVKWCSYFGKQSGNSSND